LNAVAVVRWINPNCAQTFMVRLRQALVALKNGT
jgi:hypothetical protein